MAKIVLCETSLSSTGVALTTPFCYNHFVQGLVEYFSGVKSELGKVVWPKRNEVVRQTLLVFIISGVVGLYLGALDFGFTKGLELIITK